MPARRIHRNRQSFDDNVYGIRVRDSSVIETEAAKLSIRNSSADKASSTNDRDRRRDARVYRHSISYGNKQDLVIVEINVPIRVQVRVDVDRIASTPWQTAGDMVHTCYP